MSAIAGFGIIGPTGERLATATPVAEVQRLTTPSRIPTPSAPERIPSASAAEGVRISLSTRSDTLSNERTGERTNPADPATNPSSYAAQLAQKRYLQNSSSASFAASSISQNERSSIIG